LAEEWEPASLGDERIDGQHRQIALRLRVLEAALGSGRVDALAPMLRALALALAEHFRDEERWMEEAGYPGIAEHARRHDALLLQLADGIEPPPGYMLDRGVADLAAAVEVHLRAEDVKLARFFAARANFRKMAEASGGKGPALTPLPGQLEPIPPPKRPPR
jgi:hemerythrin-like metal-binding protein